MSKHYQGEKGFCRIPFIKKTITINFPSVKSLGHIVGQLGWITSYYGTLALKFID